MPTPLETVFLARLAQNAPDLITREATSDQQSWVEGLIAADVQAALHPLPPELIAPLLPLEVKARLAGHATAFPDSRVQVISQAGEAIGYWRMDWSGTPPRLVDIIIMAEARGQGHGGRLLGCLAAAADTLALPLALSVRPGNPAEHLYHRLGFTPISPPNPSVEMRRASASLEAASRTRAW
ncbi:GNAT family N-acetyltransferase [Nitrospirillum sp. BR 11828]|uniref:GNAT family N-acetyltransferase n=1 Tax=Nitrospirillum sp. BR 11828 TaxID=3104325 RepID=UPI002ACAD322|nr:GNAT family N-acetyltransferase [Nitrospirillum sp. BR 11828]MDZ5645890.1 GNAT family N-acetyltransferase [Nitrospirillum sp. BR 11828]